MTATLDTNPTRPDGRVALRAWDRLGIRQAARTWRGGGGIVATALVLLAVALSGHGLGHDLILPAGIVLIVALAYANGSNDVSKAIATLAGSGITNYRSAIAWGPSARWLARSAQR